MTLLSKGFIDKRPIVSKKNSDVDHFDKRKKGAKKGA